MKYWLLAIVLGLTVNQAMAHGSGHGTTQGCHKHQTGDKTPHCH